MKEISGELFWRNVKYSDLASIFMIQLMKSTRDLDAKFLT
jgi:hypothetical protein